MDDRSSKIADLIRSIAPKALDPNDVDRFIEYFDSILGKIGPVQPLPPTLWHYTTGDGLIGIVESGELFATHISCLNDSLEYRYLIDLVRRKVKEAGATADEDHHHFYERMTSDELDVSKVDTLVTCFTRKRDDLGQWRGYGGGVSGYAIEFHTDHLIKCVEKTRPEAVIARVRYDEERHIELASEIVAQVTRLYFQGSPKDAKAWEESLFPAYMWLTSTLAALSKHPSFRDEEEHRIIFRLRSGEHKALEFRQKSTLLTRYLKVDCRDASDHLPIKTIMIGPGSNREVTRTGIYDLLEKKGYAGIPVVLSTVPYRLP